MTLWEVRVARSDECRLEQKAGYSQHTATFYQKPATLADPSPFKTKTATIINVLIQMKNDNRSHYTIDYTRKHLTYLSRHADLEQPETIKRFIADADYSDGYKKLLCESYDRYAQYYHIEWDKPRYRPQAKAIKIPTKEKLEMLIASPSRILATKLTLSMETGMRPIELCNLRVKDVDLEQRTIYPATAKRGRARTFKISNKLTQLLEQQIITADLKPTDKLNAQGAF